MLAVLCYSCFDWCTYGSKSFLHVSLVIMDPVRKLLNEVEGMMNTLKAKLGDTAIEIDLARSKTDISRRQLCQRVDRFTVTEREKLDTMTYTEFETFCSMLEKSLAAIVRGGVDDVRAFFRGRMQHE